MHKTQRKFLAGLIACAFQPAFAEEPATYDLGTIVVTPARAPQPRASGLQSVTVIGPNDIARAGQQSLPELLQTLGGVEIRRTGGPGQLSSVFIRGTNSNHTVVLVDGVRVDNITSGTTALEHIPPEQIERIEILRGPGSSLYGADAIGGVIQIFTRRPTGQGVEAMLGAGSARTLKSSLGAWQRAGSTQLSLRLAYEHSDAFSASNATASPFVYNPDSDPYRNGSINIHVDHEWGEAQRFGVSLFQARGTAHYDAGMPSDAVKVETLQKLSAYSRNRITTGWESLVRVSQGVDDYHWRDPAYDPIKSKRDQFTWQNDVQMGVGTLTAGVEYDSQRLITPAAYAAKTRHNAAAFALYRADLARHSVQLSIRHDDNSQFGGFDTGNLAYGLRLSPSLRVSGSLGTAFRAPSFMDLYFPNFGNPALRPERAVGGELAVSYDDRKRSARLTWFSHRITDLIAFDPMTTKPSCPFGCPVNIDKAKTQGLELVATLPLSESLALGVNATVQQAVDAATQRRLRQRAEMFGSITAKWRKGPWHLGLEEVASGDRFDSRDEAPASRMGGYAITNLTAEYALSKALSAFARWNNVFDREYELAKGYNTPGRSIFVGVRYQAEPRR